jgi:hypothetical protein
VESAVQLASQLDEPVWVPSQWPASVSGPEYVLMLHPADGRRNGYQLRGFDEGGRLLIVHGHRRQPGHLESGLLAIEGELFVTLARPEGQPVHIVIRAPVFDVHVSGEALPYQKALSLSRDLVKVGAM